MTWFIDAILGIVIIIAALVAVGFFTWFFMETYIGNRIFEFGQFLVAWAFLIALGCATLFGLLVYGHFVYLLIWH